jgi:hypothetical protein
MEMNDKPSSIMPRVISEYFNDINDIKKHTHYDELFNANKENVDLQTELNENEIRAIAILQTNDKFLVDKGVGSVYNNYINNFMRLKISLNRQSRKEYVEVNKNENKELNAMQKIFGNGTGLVK